MARRCTITTVLLLGVLASGCSSPDESAVTPRTSSEGSGLSLAFATKCARCHGVTAKGQGAAPSLPGALSEAATVCPGSIERDRIWPLTGDLMNALVKAVSAEDSAARA